MDSLRLRNKDTITYQTDQEREQLKSQRSLELAESNGTPNAEASPHRDEDLQSHEPKNWTDSTSAGILKTTTVEATYWPSDRHPWPETDPASPWAISPVVESRSSAGKV